MPPHTSRSHPVWAVYDELRVARLNVEYYGALRDALIRQNNTIEYVLAATASGSAIAAFSVWETAIGDAVWKSLLAISALLALYKPIAKLTDKLEKIDAVLPTYRELEHDLKNLARDIEIAGAYTTAHQRKFRAQMDRKEEVMKESPGLIFRKRLHRRCVAATDKAYPAENFFIPEEGAEERPIPMAPPMGTQLFNLDLPGVSEEDFGEPSPDNEPARHVEPDQPFARGHGGKGR